MLEAMRVRLLGPRLLATILTLLWGTAAALVLVGYRPGGSIDLLVGVAAALTIHVAAGLRGLRAELAVTAPR